MDRLNGKKLFKISAVFIGIIMMAAGVAVHSVMAADYPTAKVNTTKLAVTDTRSSRSASCIR
ncbi:MAG: hypothetical protein MPW15_15345 [Candidatus Manganitrophus sp.]|nr:hypothetical protein [Candidatus Manganitrophus sp.]